MFDFTCRFTCAIAVALAALGLCGLSPLRAANPGGSDADLSSSTNVAVERIEVQPSEIQLHAASREQQLLVTLVTSDGRAIDATEQCSVTVQDRELVEVQGATLRAVHDGDTRITVSAMDRQVELPVHIVGTDKFPPIDFASDVVPVLSKLGCNSGGCHGRVQGQNGFKLSVFGYDPASDHAAIVQEGRGRRVFPASPRESLLLRKATAAVAHGGGQRLKEDSADYVLLQRWIEQGMPPGSSHAPRLVALEVIPRERVLVAEGRQQILATAIYSDGSRRDVTHAAQYASNATHVAEVDSSGLIRCGAPSGEAAITVNYMGQVAAVEISRPQTAISQDYASLPVFNHIDELVWAKLKRMGLLPSELASDAVFLRRMYLDVLGTLPTAEEVQSFLTDADPQKRAKWIDSALERPEYADYWALKWADILLVDKEKLGDRGAYEFHRWLREQFESNRPYDQWVRDILTATGNSGRNGPVNLYRAADTPDALARTISQAFLGVRLECAQCHHHPFDRWSQSDFYGMAGYFQGLERKPLSTDRVLLVHTGYRPAAIPVTNVIVPTRPLGEESGDAAQESELAKGDPRVMLADWLTRPTNPWFARMFVNRLWKQLMGRGLVEAEDDMRMTNPATNEPLLDYLAAQAVECRFDQKAILRLILNSRVYQTSSVPNPTNHGDDQNFSHYYPKRMSAEVLLDAISSATGTSESFPGQPAGTRALQLWDNRLPSYFLEIFGRPARNSPCECGRSSEPTMAQALHLTNAPEVEAKISAEDGRVAQLLADAGFLQSDKTVTVKTVTASDDGLTDSFSPDALAPAPPAPEIQRRLIEQITLATVSRLPSDKELRVAEELFQSTSPRQAAEDFLWTMLNSYDFLFIQ